MRSVGTCVASMPRMPRGLPGWSPSTSKTPSSSIATSGTCSSRAICAYPVTSMRCTQSLCVAPHPSAMVMWSCPRALRHRMTPRTNSGSVVRPRTPSSPSCVAGSLNQSNPPMLGLRRMGVEAGFFGTTAAQSRCPRSRAAWASLLWRTTTGALSAARRALLRARRAAPSTSPPAITGASASSVVTGDACVVTSAVEAEGAAGEEGAASGAELLLEEWQARSDSNNTTRGVEDLWIITAASTACTPGRPARGARRRRGPASAGPRGCCRETRGSCR